MAARDVGDLHVADALEQPTGLLGEVALENLHVEEVVLQERVFGADFVEHLDRLRARAKEVVLRRVLAHRLDEELHLLAGKPRRGMAQVGDVGRMQLAPVRARRHDSGKAVQARTARRARILERALEGLAEGLLPARKAGRAVLAALRVAARHVVQHDLHARLAHRRSDVGRGEIVGILVLDRAESGAARGREPLEEADLGKEHRQIGGEPRHRTSIAFLAYIRGGGTLGVFPRGT